MNGRDHPTGTASGIDFYSEEEENEYANQLIAESLEVVNIGRNVRQLINNNGTKRNKTNNDKQEAETLAIW